VFLRRVPLAVVLLVATTAELIVYRLAVPALSPAGDVEPPGWHVALTYLGLFLFYFTATLAVFAIATRLVAMVRTRAPYAALPRHLLVACGLGFVLLAVRALTSAPGEALSFVLEGGFVATVVCLAIAQLGGGGDRGVRVGLVLFALPLVLHFWGPVAARFVFGGEALWNGLPERVQSIGLKLMVMAAVASPYCFAPRPFVESASRPVPFAVSAFVGVVGAVIMRQSHTVGAELAANGLGIDLGAGAPTSEIALYILALTSITWTIVACLGAASAARRQIGVGLALVVLAGYAFAWPLQLLSSVAGLLVVGAAGVAVAGEESAAARGVAVLRPPPIEDAAWQRWLEAVTRRLADRGGQAVTVGDHDAARSHLVATPDGVPVKVTIERIGGRVSGVDVLCGEEPGAAAPAWTMAARVGRRLGLDRHPEPPSSSGRVVKTGDGPFDRRFRIRDDGAHTARLFDEGLRARATASLDGWLALWPAQAVRYRVHPGRGAPLDQPIPISELAFRDGEPLPSVEKLVALIELCAAIGARAGIALASESESESTSTSEEAED
jgi:hypothetical protein